MMAANARPRPLAAAGLIVLCEGLALGVLLPVISFRVEELGGDAHLVGLLFALVSLPKLITNPLFGAWSDRVGRRAALAVATAGTLLGSVLWALAGSLAGLIIARTVTGIFGAQAGLAQAVAADVSTPERRAASVGVLGAAFGISLTLGPLLGGLIGQWLGYAAVGWLSAGFQAVSLIVIAGLLNETRPVRGVTDPPESHDLSRIRDLLRLSTVATLLGVTLLVTLATSEWVATFTLVAADLYRFDVRKAGMGFAVIGVIGALIQGGLIRQLTQRFGEVRVALAGLALLALGFLGMSSAPGLAGFWITLVLLSVGIALATPTLASLLSRSVGSDAQGALAGLNQAALGVGRGAGNYAGGLLYGWGGAPWLFATAATLSVGAAGWLWTWQRARGPVQPAIAR